MSFTSSLVIAASLLFPSPAVTGGPSLLKGEVADEFEDDRLLLAIGSENGAQKGMRGLLMDNATLAPSPSPNPYKQIYANPLVVGGKGFRPTPNYVSPYVVNEALEFTTSKPRAEPSRPIWRVEFVEVGVKHSVVKRIDPSRTEGERRFHRNDSVIWLNESPPPSGARDLSGFRDPLGGGAYIDLTKPAAVSPTRSK